MDGCLRGAWRHFPRLVTSIGATGPQTQRARMPQRGRFLREPHEWPINSLCSCFHAVTHGDRDSDQNSRLKKHEPPQSVGRFVVGADASVHAMQGGAMGGRATEGDRPQSPAVPVVTEGSHPTLASS